MDFRSARLAKSRIHARQKTSPVAAGTTGSKPGERTHCSATNPLRKRGLGGMESIGGHTAGFQMKCQLPWPVSTRQVGGPEIPKSPGIPAAGGL